MGSLRPRSCLRQLRSRFELEVWRRLSVQAERLEGSAIGSASDLLDVSMTMSVISYK